MEHEPCTYSEARRFLQRTQQSDQVERYTQTANEWSENRISVFQDGDKLQYELVTEEKPPYFEGETLAHSPRIRKLLQDRVNQWLSRETFTGTLPKHTKLYEELVDS